MGGSYYPICSTPYIIISVIRYYCTGTNKIVVLVQNQACPGKFTRIRLSLLFSTYFFKSSFSASLFTSTNISWFGILTFLLPKYIFVCWPTSCNTTWLIYNIIKGWAWTVATTLFVCLTITFELSLWLGFFRWLKKINCFLSSVSFHYWS